MSDAAAILSLYDHARAHALPAVLATVVGTAGSTYRKRGARMMLCGDGSRVGVVSGGCLEVDVARRAWFLKSPGEAELVRYDTGNGEDATYEFGLGCRGVVDVLLERLDTTDAEPMIITALRRAVVERLSSVFATALSGSGIGNRMAIADPAQEADASTLIEQIDPPIQLVLFGSGMDVVPVLQIARTQGWRAVLIDRRLGSNRAWDADCVLDGTPMQWMHHVRMDAMSAGVLMTHRMTDDAGYLRDLLGSLAGYIGVLGPRSRTEALFDELAIAGSSFTPTQVARVHSPIGLDIGAERPQEIALAIAAEVHAFFAGSLGGKLSARNGAIHLSPRVASTPAAAMRSDPDRIQTT